MCPTESDVLTVAAVIGDNDGLQVASIKDTAKLPPTMVSIDRLLLSERQTAQVERENRRLTSQLKEVIGMNRQWQRYDEQREAYVIKLHKVHEELLGKISILQKSNSNLQMQVSHERPSQTEKRCEAINVSSSTITHTADQDKAHTSPMYSLDARMALKEKELYTLRDEVDRLNEYIASLQRSETKRRKDENERISIFKVQIETCMEDFRQERADGEKVKKQTLQLRKHLEEAEKTIAGLTQEVDELVAEIQWLQDRPSRYTHQYVNYTAAPTKPNHYNKPGTYRQTARIAGTGYDVPDYSSLLPSNVETDGFSRETGSLGSSSISQAAPLATSEEAEDITQTPSITGETDPAVSSRQGCILLPKEKVLEKALKCPQCLEGFVMDEYTKLLEHIELCQGEHISPDLGTMS